MYGAQTIKFIESPHIAFENDVEMYGAQTTFVAKFENDVEMYGAQT